MTPLKTIFAAAMVGICTLPLATQAQDAQQPLTIDQNLCLKGTNSTGTFADVLKLVGFIEILDDERPTLDDFKASSEGKDYHFARVTYEGGQSFSMMFDKKVKSVCGIDNNAFDQLKAQYK